MFTRPDDLADAEIVTALSHRWGFQAVSADYLSVGFGSHHWVARSANGERWFVTVDDLTAREFLGRDPASAFDALGNAFMVARTLWLGGAAWVVAPVPNGDGEVLRRLADRYSIAVFPYVDGVATKAYTSSDERAAVVALLAELHQRSAPAQAHARRETFAVPHRQDLTKALDSVGHPWSGGPYAEPARELLEGHLGHVRRMLLEYDGLVREAVERPADWTLTHGEPHSANVLRTQQGLRLIDWDTALVAPPERDLWMLVSSGSDALSRQYAAAGGHQPREGLLRLYAVAWDLAELGAYLAEMRSSHADTEDTLVAWRALQDILA